MAYAPWRCAMTGGPRPQTASSSRVRLAERRERQDPTSVPTSKKNTRRLAFGCPRTSEGR